MIILSITDFITWFWGVFFSALKKITKKYHITPPLKNFAGLSR